MKRASGISAEVEGHILSAGAVQSSVVADDTDAVHAVETGAGRVRLGGTSLVVEGGAHTIHGHRNIRVVLHDLAGDRLLSNGKSEQSAG